jgi:hypothetical protein
MTRRALLLDRIDAIGAALAATGDALALLGLGSIGKELDRLDDYSDLDFFAVAKPGKKARFLENLDWLDALAEPAFRYKNTADGYKYLYADGVFLEFAVFEPEELAKAAFSEGRLVWAEPGFDAALCRPPDRPPLWRPADLDWALNEIATCLYVGLGRYARGERLSGTRFVQNYAVDLLLACSDRLFAADGAAPGEAAAAADGFQHERRIERRCPELGRLLPRLVPGYERTPEAALALLEFVDGVRPVAPALEAEIRRLYGLLRPARDE